MEMIWELTLQNGPFYESYGFKKSESLSFLGSLSPKNRLVSISPPSIREIMYSTWFLK